MGGKKKGHTDAWLVLVAWCSLLRRLLRPIANAHATRTSAACPSIFTARVQESGTPGCCGITTKAIRHVNGDTHFTVALQLTLSN
mmetsp:Transcript_60229/g.168124  ORF Transcript_60229/g.168124 Transcript_60229/m.168124 type:complete len:85 (-) Transcript_60229:1318-1572(-)